MDALYYSDECCTLPNLKDEQSLSDAIGDDALNDFVKRVYKGAYKKGGFDPKRVSAYAKVFSKAIMKGFADGGGNTQADFDTPDASMLAALRTNVFHFSAAKNRAEIVQMSAKLRDPKGKLRSFKDFAHEAQKIGSDFQGRYLKVEYDNAVNSSYLAARWNEYEEDDILVFRTAGDERVRTSHKELDGTSLPKNHPFWKSFYPPLAWNCRCTVEVTHSGRATAEEQIPWGEIDSVPPIFRSNFAAEGMAFPPKHPYYIVDGTPALANTDTTPYEVDVTPNGNKVFESNATHKRTKSAGEAKRQKIEYTQNRISARLMADQYNDDVLLMPELASTVNDVRYTWEYLMRGYQFKPKMADSLLLKNNLFYEVKSYEGKYSYDKFSKMMRKLQKQAEIGVLYINQDIDLGILQKDLKTYLYTLKKNQKPFETKDVFVIINQMLYKIH